MKLTLTYFDFPFWRAEVSRLALHLGGIPFEDVRPGREAFRALKKEGALPFGQLPVLDVDGVRYAQSVAIARFCGQLSGFYPKEDPLAALRVDELLDAVSQINYALYPSVWEKDPDKKMAMRAILGSETIPRWLAAVEARLLQNATQRFLVGPAMTVADLAVWRVVGWLTGGILDGIPTDLLDAVPALKSHHLGIDSEPRIRAWMDTHYARH